MAAQRNSKILGIFVRLNERDGKPAYLKHLPRIRNYLERALAHPALAELQRLLPAQWTDRGTCMSFKPKTAMVLAGGRGLRMRPITNTIPKPLVKVAGRTLLDRGLDTLAAAGVEKAVVNVHHFPEQIVAHVASRADAEGGDLRRERRPARFGRRHRQGAAEARPRAVLHPQRRHLLDRSAASRTSPASPLPGTRREWIFCSCSQTSIPRPDTPAAPTSWSAATARCRRAHGDPAGLIYAGAAIVNPAIFAGAPEGPLSLNRYFDEAIANGRLFGLTDARTLDHRRHAGRDPARRSRRRAGAGRSGMSGRTLPRVFSIPPGAAFLPTLADALLSGRLVPDFRHDGDPLKLAGATIYVPTRRAARELRSVFVERSAGGSAILPTVRPLGEFDEDEAAFGEEGAGALDLAPPISAIDRLLHLAPLVRAWKKRLPAHVAALFEEEMVVPASAADAIWLARDLAALMDEIETEGSDWTRLAELAPENLSGWWQVTLDFLSIVTEHWPDFLAARGQSNPAAHRSALIRLEAERLQAKPARRAGDRGGLDRLHSGDGRTAGGDRAAAERRGRAAGARQGDGRAVLVGADGTPRRNRPCSAIRNTAWRSCSARSAFCAATSRRSATPDAAARLRARLVSEALRPAETTDEWAGSRTGFGGADIDAALGRRDAGRGAARARRGGRHRRRAAGRRSRRPAARRRWSPATASWRAASRRSSCASACAPTIPAARRWRTRRPAALLRLMLEAVFRPGDPVAVVALLKHPLLTLGLERARVRHAAETIELVALRGGTGRPDIATLGELFDARLVGRRQRKPFWLPTHHRAAGSPPRGTCCDGWRLRWSR